MSSIKNVIKEIFPLLFLGLASSLQLIGASLYLDIPLDFVLVALCFIITGGVYLLNRILDEEDVINCLSRWQFFSKMPWLILAILFLIGPILFLFATNNSKQLLVFAIIAVAGTAYSVKLVPSLFTKRRIHWRRLKDFTIWKPVVPSVIWAGGGLAIAIAMKNGGYFFRIDIVVLFITFFVCNLVSTISSDVRDVYGDGLKKVRTIPVLLGANVTGIFLMVLIIIAMAGIAALWINGAINMKTALYSNICILWALVSALPVYVKPESLSRFAKELLVDSHLVLSPLGLVIISII